MIVRTDKIYYDDCVNIEKRNTHEYSVFRTFTLLSSLEQAGYVYHDNQSGDLGSFILTSKGHRFFGLTQVISLRQRLRNLLNFDNKKRKLIEKNDTCARDRR